MKLILNHQPPKFEYRRSGQRPSPPPILTDEQPSSHGSGIDATPSITNQTMSSISNHEMTTLPATLGLGARELDIAHGPNPSHWRWCSDDSLGVEVAELVGVWWLEIRGYLPVKNLGRSACYGAFFVFKLTCNPIGLESAYGSLRFVDEDGSHWIDDLGSAVFIENRRLGLNPSSTFGGEADQFPDRRSDGWMEVKLGSFFNNHENSGCSHVEMRLFNTTSLGQRKSGLIVKGIELRLLN